MLVEHDLFGNVYDKVQVAIDIARTFEPKNGEGYYLAYSGGKDSVCVKRILDMAGVKYDAHYNVTTVDPPELVRFIISQFDGVIYDMPDGTHRYYVIADGRLYRRDEAQMPEKVIHFSIPEMPMRELIVKKEIPPTRLMRYCCKELKEGGGMYRKVVTGVRQAESANRKANQGAVVVTKGAKDVAKMAEEHGVNFTQTLREGVVLNYDDADSRIIVEHCYRTAKTLINPIAYWSNEDVWEFIHQQHLPYCKLYDEGFKRLGCVGCPLGNFAAQRCDFKRWPQYRKMYVRAFDKMLEARRKAGKTNKNRLWTDGEDVMQWWTGYDANNNPDQIGIDELETM